MAGETTITMVGRIIDDVNLKYTSQGTPWISIPIADSPRIYNRQEGRWETDRNNSLILNCTAWRDLAENIAQTLQKGMRVIVTGRLVRRQYQTQDGQKRYAFDLQIEEIGPSLRYATAQVTERERTDFGNAGGGYGSAGGFNQAAPQQSNNFGQSYGQPSYANAPSQAAQPAAPVADPWGESAPSSFDNEPPF